MNFTPHLTNLLAIGIVNAGADYLLAAFIYEDLFAQWPFMLLSIVLFFVLSIAVFKTAVPVSKHKNKAKLAQYVLILTFVKMMLSIAFVYGYYLIAKPPSSAFVFPFFLSYSFFTIYETRFLVKLSLRTS